MLAKRGSILTGVGIGLGLSAAAITHLLLWSSKWKTSTGQWTYENPAVGVLLLIGVVQILWMTPTVLALFLAQRIQTLKGVLLVAAAVFLLNAAFVLSMFRGARSRFAL
jgi:hypothetical protein